jgi:hypothetical protein
MSTLATTLQNWADKQMREVTEGVRPPARIVLTSEGVTWERWEPVMGLDPAEWTRATESYLDALADELPKRKVQLTFSAEDATGATLSTFLRTITGRNQAAADLGTQAGAKALADGIASIAKTTDAVLLTARNMMEFMGDQIRKREEDLSLREKDLREAHALIAMIQKIEAEEGTASNPVAGALAKHIDDAAPMALQAVSYWLQKRQDELTEKAKAAAKTAVAVVTNPAGSPAPTNGSH